jgi:NAD(P)-dependent dehydrogenase (short-subunit alcohol dehydrogenase family)
MLFVTWPGLGNPTSLMKLQEEAIMTVQDGHMAGKVCMVTGATSGIGLVTARTLAQQGATVIAVGRNLTKGTSTVAHIQQETGNPSVEYMQADLSAQAQIRRLAQEFKSRYSHLHVLVNNAGGFFIKRQLSVDGIEMTFALNHLNYFLLTNLLLDTLKTSAPARVVNVASDTHRRAKMDFENLEGERKYSGMRAYGQSKLAVVLFTYELARRLEGTQVTANALHPGFVATNIGRNNRWLFRLVAPLIKLIALSPEEGAQTSIYLASSPEVAEVTGKHFDQKKPGPPAPASYDQAAARRLWEISAEMTGLEN